MTSAEPRPFWPILLGLLLVGPTASHAVTGLLAHLGWYRSIGLEFDAWYLDPAYQSFCWFAMGVGLTLLIPRFVIALREAGREPHDGTD